MLGLILGPIRFLIGGPVALCSAIFACVGIGFCMKRCIRCRLRDCLCCKRLLRFIGTDQFDDFELMVLVHEALFDQQEEKMKTIVRVTAGAHVVKTDPNKKSSFQQPLHITVEQGTSQVIVDLLDSSGRVLATLPLESMSDILNEEFLQPEKIYNMKSKSNRINKPRVKLTMVVGMEDDAEKGLLANMNSDVDILVQQHLKKAKREGGAREGEIISEMAVLKQACAGPLEIFGRLGMTQNVYVSVLGPPVSRRWFLGIWKDKRDFDLKKQAMQEIDLMRIESVQGDPTRNHVFVINGFDEKKIRKTLTFRRVDRARDVWVEILHLLVLKARAMKKSSKGQSSRMNPDSSDTGLRRPEAEARHSVEP